MNTFLNYLLARKKVFITLGLTVIAGLVVILYSVNHHSGQPVTAKTKVSVTTSKTQNSKSTYYAFTDPNKFTAQQLFEVIDAYRVNEGIAQLQEDPSLDGAARLRAYAIQQYGENYEADSNSVFNRISAAVPATTLGDEIYWNICSGVSSYSTFRDLIANDSINQVLTDPKYTFAGVGVAESDTSTCNGYVVIELADIN